MNGNSNVVRDASEPIQQTYELDIRDPGHADHSRHYLAGSGPCAPPLTWSFMDCTLERNVVAVTWHQ